MIKTACSVGALLALVLATGALSACGPGVNAATVATADFEEFMRAQPGVVSAEARGSNTLPYSGTAEGEVVMRDDLPAEEFANMIHTVGEYSKEQRGSGVGWTSMTVSLAGYTLSVERSRADNNSLLALYDAVRASPLYTGGVVGTIEVELDLAGEPSVAGLVSALDTTNVMLEAHPIAAGATVLAFARADGLSDFRVEQLEPGRRPESSIAALLAVSATAAITAADISDTSFSVQLADEAAVAGATALVTGQLADSAVVDISVWGPVG